jgi:hypothetical protein
MHYSIRRRNNSFHRIKIRSGIPEMHGKISNVLLEDKEDQMDRSCKKLIIKSQGGEEYPTIN